METAGTSGEIPDEDANCVLVAIVVNECGDVINHYRIRCDGGDFIGEDDACRWDDRFEQYEDAVEAVRAESIAEALVKRGSAYLLANVETALYGESARRPFAVGDLSTDVPRVAIRSGMNALRGERLNCAWQNVREMLTTSLAPREDPPWRVQHGTVSRADLLAYALRRCEELGHPIGIEAVNQVLEIEFEFLNARGLATALVCEPTPSLQEMFVDEGPIKSISSALRDSSRA